MNLISLCVLFLIESVLSAYIQKTVFILVTNQEHVSFTSYYKRWKKDNKLEINNLSSFSKDDLIQLSNILQIVFWPYQLLLSLLRFFLWNQIKTAKEEKNLKLLNFLIHLAGNLNDNNCTETI